MYLIINLKIRAEILKRFRGVHKTLNLKNTDYLIGDMG